MPDENTPSSSEIEVDDAAAYFGVTESSDVLHAMMRLTQTTSSTQHPWQPLLHRAFQGIP